MSRPERRSCAGIGLSPRGSYSRRHRRRRGRRKRNGDEARGRKLWSDHGLKANVAARPWSPDPPVIRSHGRPLPPQCLSPLCASEDQRKQDGVPDRRVGRGRPTPSSQEVTVLGGLKPALRTVPSRSALLFPLILSVVKTPLGTSSRPTTDDASPLVSLHPCAFALSSCLGIEIFPPFWRSSAPALRGFPAVGPVA